MLRRCCLPCRFQIFDRYLLSPRFYQKMAHEEFLTEFSKRREPSVLRELTRAVVSARKGTISFATGMPNPSTFPFAEMTVKLKNGGSYTVKGKELESALQYQPSTGYGPLLSLLQDMQNRAHGQQDWSKKAVIVTTGSTDGISRAVEMLLNRGDPVILQHPLYSGIENMLKPYQLKYILAEQDADGVDPQLLRQALEEHKSTGAKMPRVMYLNPTGANPTGTVLTTERKKALYKLAQEYNLIILEDDAYFHLHFLEKDPVSFLSMDADNRVLRFDSFSKVLSSGFRLGVVTGSQDLLRRIELHIQSSTMHTSSIAQVLAHELLKSWGPEKLEEHFQSVRNFYRERRDIMLGAAEKHLAGLADWTVPAAGMFLWMQVRDVSDTNVMVMERGVSQQIILVPGRCFNVDPSQGSPYIRAAFSIASAHEIDEGMMRLAKLIREEQKLPNKVGSA